jgi:hypothetical protein
MDSYLYLRSQVKSSSLLHPALWPKVPVQGDHLSNLCTGVISPASYVPLRRGNIPCVP